MRQLTVGIIGCGSVCPVYLHNSYRHRNLRLVALADIDPGRAAARVETIRDKYHAEWRLPGTPELPRACTVPALLADPSIELVLNLTPPPAHAEVTLQALAAGKHVYSEKPLGRSRGECAAIAACAAEKGLLVGSAPDTFLGGSLQTARKLLDDGWIGTPIACCAFMTSTGPESWHPSPEFFYKQGGGPLFDMGPYYLTALVHLLGPVARVSSAAKTPHALRTVTSVPRRGEHIPVETPTTVAGLLEFASGVIGTMLMSFDIHGTRLPRLEVYGTLGSLSLLDPNTFGGALSLKIGDGEWTPLPFTHGYTDNARGLGAADLASAFLHRRAPRASLELATHVVDVICSCLDAAESGATMKVGTRVDRPLALPMGLGRGEID